MRATGLLLLVCLIAAVQDTLRYSTGLTFLWGGEQPARSARP
jgi:hypothetical protein